MDMSLTTNELLLFDLERTEFVQKSKLRDLLQMNQPLTSRGEEGGSALRTRITAKLGTLSQFDYQSSKASRFGDFDDIKSKVAPSTARSLNLAV